MPLRMYPWIGCRYEDQNEGFGLKLLVVGESHYPTPNDAEPSLGLTQRVVRRRVDGQNPQPFFTTMTKVLTENPTNTDVDFSVWHSVAFYNYIQSFVDKGPPKEHQWREAVEPFGMVLKFFQPDAVLVASCRVGRRIERREGIEFAVMPHPRILDQQDLDSRSQDI